MSIGDNIRHYRKQAGMTQQELAEKSGVAAISIRQYEAGKRTPQTKQLAALGEALGVAVQKFLNAGSDPAPDNMLNGVAQKIQAARKRSGMTQGDLGRKLGVSGSMVGQWESGKRNPKYETVCHIARVLGVSANELFASFDRSPHDSSADECEYVRMLRHYQEDLPDVALLDEAITTLENYFSHMDKAALLHFSRPLAIAYLALKHEQNKKDAE